MKTYSIIATLLILIYSATLNAQDITRYEATARKLLNHTLDKEIDEMMIMFSDDFLKQVSRQQLFEIANGLEAQLGKFSHVTRVLHETSDKYHTVILASKFGDKELGVRVTIDQNGKVAGFFITMLPPAHYTPPPLWADSTKFRELFIEVDCGNIGLPAILSIPVDAEKVPIVVLVHGSGPHDKDASIGPNKIFRDIAWGLASNGIAVLRYEKRSFRHQNTLDPQNLTVWDEAGSDALHALNLAKALPNIDTNRVFVLGHSLGGMIAPRIAKYAPWVNGIISLAGSPRQLYEIIPDQLRYLMSLRQSLSDYEKSQLNAIIETANRIAENRNNPDAINDLQLLGMPASYINDMIRNDVSLIAGEIPQSFMILQGGRDYQITMDDFDAWKRVLKMHHDSTFKLYPELNHLFFPGEGPSSPNEYFLENNVSKRVIDDIADWINKR